MISKAKGKRLIPAAEYLRYSSDQQDGSDEQQAREIGKLAEREGVDIVATFTDKAISGDTGREDRPDLARMLDAAERGDFQVLLAWDVSRIGRQDSIDAGLLLKVLRDKGVRIVTCRDGSFNLRDSNDRIRYAFLTEGGNTENVRRAYNVTRGLIANAKAGNRNGGKHNYGMDRVQVDQAGRIIRRLAPGQRKDNPAHHVRQVPSEQTEKVEAIRYALDRFASADVSAMQVARELDAKGYPSPSGDRWSSKTLKKILANPVYRGVSRWGPTTWGKYYTFEDGTPVPREDHNGTRPEEDVIFSEPSEGIVPAKLFDRVQRKLAKRFKRRAARREQYPLSGLLVCSHCGPGMHGSTIRRRSNGKAYSYERYVCSSYTRDTVRSECGHYWVSADKMLGWLVPALQEVFLGPGRDALVRAVRRRLKAEANGGEGSDTKRLEKRLATLKSETDNLVRAVRKCPDVDELVAELAKVRAEHRQVEAELVRASRGTTSKDIDSEAERIVDQVWQLGEALTVAEPATLRELFRQMLSRIECRWEKAGRMANGRERTKLIGGTVFLRPNELFSALSDNGTPAKRLG